MNPDNNVESVKISTNVSDKSAIIIKPVFFVGGKFEFYLENTDGLKKLQEKLTNILSEQVIVGNFC